MSCLYPLIFCLASVEARADTSYQVTGRVQYEYGGHRYNAYLGTVEISAGSDPDRTFSLRYGLRHMSVINAPDRGEERAFLQLIWRPFR